MIFGLELLDGRLVKGRDRGLDRGVRLLALDIEDNLLADVGAAAFIEIGLRRQFGKETGLKPAEVLMPMRLALTGCEHGPELKYVLAALGRDEVIARIDGALVRAAGARVGDEGVTP